MDVPNGNATHKHYSLPPRPSSNALTRQKIVELLAGTANGCLSELGYFPGMPQKVKDLEHQNEQWRLENMKLYQDNASLLELIHQQNERIRQIGAPDQEKNARIMELHTELQKTRMQRDELARAQSAKDSPPSQLQQNFAHLQGDYVRVLNGYRAMSAQVERLQAQIRALAQPSKPQPQHQHQLHWQSQQQFQVQQHLQSQPPHQLQPVHVQHLPSNRPNRPVQRQSAPILLQPHLQKYLQEQLQMGQQMKIPSPLITGQGQKQNCPLLQTQQAVFEQRHQSIVQSQQPRSRQSSGSMPAHSTRSSQDSFVDIANLQQHSPLNSGGQPYSSRPNSKPPHSNGFHPTSPESLATQPRSSFSNNSGPPTPVVPSPLNQLFFVPPSSDFNIPSPKIATPPSNSSKVPVTISPQDTYLRPTNQVRLPQVKDVQCFNINTTDAGMTNSPVTGATVSQPLNIAPGLPTSIPPHQITSLKRDSPTQSEEGHHDPIEQLQKRPRLEGPQLDLTTDIPIEPVMDGTEVVTVQMDIDEDEDEDEDVVEVGPDGLRLVKDCISSLFGEEGEGEGGEGRYCKLCIARRDMGYRADPPKPFVNATDDELQEHCMTEHAEAWEDLRSSF